MPWYTDSNGFPYYVDDQSGTIVTPVTDTPPTIVAPVDTAPQPVTGVIVPTPGDIGGGFGIIPFVNAPYGVDISITMPKPPVDGGPAPTPQIEVLPRTGIDVPGTQPIDDRWVQPYTPPSGYPYVNDPTYGVVDKTSNQWLLILMLILLSRRR